MKIAMLIYQYFPYGGQQRDFMRILQRCLAAGHRVDVYCLKWQGEVPEGTDVHLVPVSALASHVVYQRYNEWVAAALRRDPVDLVLGFSKMPGLDVYYAADPCFAARMHREKRRLTKFLPRYQHFARYEASVFEDKSTTRVMVLSPQQINDFSRFYPGCESRLQLLPPGISRDRLPGPDAREIRRQFREEFNLTDDEHAVLQVGSGFRVKGLDRAIRALAKLPEKLRRKTRFLIVGQGKAAKYERLARRLGVAAQCQFLGGRDDVPRFMLGSDLLLHPAHHESAGYTLLEALINGLPVLTTDTCGYAFHVSKAGAGQVCPSPFMQKDLNSRLHEMLISSDRANWQRNGLEYADKIDLSGMADTVLSVLEDVAAQKIQRSSPMLKVGS